MGGGAGARARTVVIVTAAPGCDDTEHTVNTLRTACMMAGLEGRTSRSTNHQVSLDDNGAAGIHKCTPPPPLPPACRATPPGAGAGRLLHPHVQSDWQLLSLLSTEEKGLGPVIIPALAHESWFWPIKSDMCHAVEHREKFTATVKHPTRWTEEEVKLWFQTACNGVFTRTGEQSLLSRSVSNRS